MPPEDKSPTEAMLDNVVEQSESAYAPKETGTSTDGGSAEDTSGQAPATNDTAGTTDGAGRNQKQPAGKQQRAIDPKTAATEKLRADPRGNLVDRLGNVVAQRGAERRAFETMQRDVAAHREEIQRLRGTVETYERTNSVLREAGLTPADLHTSANLLANFRKDPAGTIKMLVTEARARGHNVELDGQAIDAAAMKAAIDSATAPLREASQQRQRQEQAVRQANEEVNALYRDYPEAQAQEQSLARMVQSGKFPGRNVRELYLHLQNTALRLGLDLQKDIYTQITALAQAQATRTGQSAQTQTPSRPAAGGGIPTGRSTTTAPARLNGRGSPAPMGTSVEDRVHAALLENGIAVTR